MKVKKTIIPMLSKFVCVLFLLALVAGCSGNKGTSSVESSPESSSGESSIEATSENTSTEGSTSIAPSNTSSTSSTSKASTKPTSDKKGPKSLDEVMNSIPSKLKNTTINYFMWYDIMKHTEGPVIQDFTKRTGIKVVVEVGSYENYYTTINTKVASGKSPDVIKLLSNAIGCVKSLQPLSSSGFDFSDPAWSTVTMKDYTFNGKAFATNLKNTAFLDGAVLFYNKTIFAENDIEDPYALWKAGKWDWAAFERVAKQFISIGDGYVGASPFGYEQSFGTDIVKWDGEKYVNTIEDPEYQKVWAKQLEYYKNGIFTTVAWDMTSFMSGKCGFFFESILGAQNKSNMYQALRAKKQLAAVPFPKNGKKDYLPLIANTAWGIPKGAKNPQAVPYFLRYVLDYDNYKKDLYMDKTTQEIYESMLENPNRMQVQLSRDLITIDSGMTSHDIFYMLKSADPSQIGAELRKYTGVVNDAVKKANDQLKQMK